MATIIGSKGDAINVLAYHFISKNIDKETRKIICSIFQWLSVGNVKVVKAQKDKMSVKDWLVCQS